MAVRPQSIAGAFRSFSRRVSLPAAIRGIAICVTVITGVFAVATLPFLWKDFTNQPSTLLIIYGTWAGGWLLVYAVLGLPAHVLLALARLQRVSHYLIAGAVGGASLALLNLAVFWDAPRAEVDKTFIGVLGVVALFEAYGAAAAIAFWFAAVRRKVLRSAA